MKNHRNDVEYIVSEIARLRVSEGVKHGFFYGLFVAYLTVLLSGLLIRYFS